MRVHFIKVMKKHENKIYKNIDFYQQNVNFMVLINGATPVNELD